MARIVDPTEEKAPQEPGAPQGPTAPKEVGFVPPAGPKQAPNPEKDPYGYLVYLMEEGFGSVHARLNQQGKLVADMAEKVYGPDGGGGGQAAQVKPQGLGGIFNSDTINRFLDIAKEQLGGGENQLYIDIGKRVVDGATDTAIKGIIRSVGKQAAGDIVHVG